MRKRLLSLLLTMTMLVALLPTVSANTIKNEAFSTVSLSTWHSAAIKSDGSLWTWGHNHHGQLGDGTCDDKSTPTKIMDNVISVSLGDDHSAAIKSDGSLWTWGDNYYGKLGNGTYDCKSTPTKIMDNVISVSLDNEHSAAIKSDGSLWTWGNNYYGQLGNGTYDDKLTPTKIMDNVISVSLGAWRSAAIKSDGSLWTWGENSGGQLGDGTLDDKSTPTKIMDNVISVSLGTWHSAAIKSDGSLWTWGENFYGQLGDGTLDDKSTPTKIMDNVMLPSNITITPDPDPIDPITSEFNIENKYCVENEKNYIFGNVSISENNQTIDDVTSKITWKSSDTSIAEVGNVSYTNSEDEKSALIDMEIIGHKIGKVTITGTTADGRKAEAVVSVEPKLTSMDDIYKYDTIQAATTYEYKINTTSDNKEYFNEFLSSLSYDVTAVGAVGIEVENTDYVISSDGKSAIYKIKIKPTVNLTDNIIKLTSAYGQRADIRIRYQKRGFSIKNDGWSFANSVFSFSGEIGWLGTGIGVDKYYMPAEIYERVYGSSYISANNITTGEEFGGFCEGMSDTAILFFDGLLNWDDVNASYEEYFNTVNSYYDSINYRQDFTGLGITKQYYVSSNPESEITKLIQCYQLWGNHIGDDCVTSSDNKINKTYMKEYWNNDEAIENGTETIAKAKYEHLTYENGGTYVADVLEQIKNAVSDNTPLRIGLQYQNGGHAIVARTDKAPEDEGNGWWKVFVYNPNKPYINDNILNYISANDSNRELLQASCNELLNNGGDDYMELNPQKNLWKYHTSLISGSTEDLIGCDENETVKLMEWKDDNGERYSISLPEYFNVVNPEDFFAGTFSDPNRSWLPSEGENTITIPVSGETSFKIYSVDHDLLAIVANGYGISLNDNIHFSPYVNSDSASGATTGELTLPKDKYEFEVETGNLKIWGHNNVVNLTANAGASAIVDITKNKVDLTSNGNGNVELLMSNVSGADEYDTYKLSGELKENDTISAELPDGKPLQTESNTKDVVSVYHNSDKQENETYEYTIGEASKSTHSGGSGSSSYIIKFNSNGGSTVENQTVKKNSIATKPADPTKEGYVFGGWYTDKELITAYDFSEKVINNVSLYAKWLEIETENETIEWKNPFNDVKKDDWFYANVKYVYENGLMNGTTETTFAPNDCLTRAMLVTILYRAEGEPEVNNSIPFEDVTADSYYAKAVIWARQNGIVSGVSENEFAPDENITREQIAAIMYRYAQYKGYDVSVGENTNILSYDDFDSVSEYAISAIQYAVGSGLIKGKTETTLNPIESATRAEIAAILQRFIESNK